MSAEFFERTRTGIRNYCYRVLGKEHCKNTLFDILTFPHKNLKEALESNEEYSGSFTTPRIRQTYHKSQKLFEKITAAKEDTIKWFQYLLESNDDRFIIQNVEARISEKPTNKDLWKLYIEFLKEKDTEDKTATTYYYNSLMVNKDNLNFEGIQSVYICHVIIIELWHYTIHDPQNLILSNIIPKLKYLDLRILKINRQNISTSDYEFLTNSGNIEKIVFHGRISDARKNPISLENIFKPLSKATDIELQTKVTITPNSWKILVSNKKEFKTNFIYFPDCDSIDYFDFIEYLLHNCADNSHVVYPHVANGIEMENGIRCVVENAKQENIKFFPKIDLRNYYAGMPKFVLFESYL
uniref:DUF38 domain-containing protein n=1 Tax=Panagrolaimus davidi TaxID=227884 RepID=A0A914P675_9BILA